MVFQTRSGADLLFSSNQQADQSLLAPSNFRLRMRNRAVPFASISSSLLRNLGAEGAAGGRKETHTGLEYPLQYCHSNHHICPELAGLGVRAKKILGLKNINVYALGIYVDSAAAKKALGHKFKAAPDASTLAKDQALFDEVVSNDHIDKTLRLVISFGALKRAQFVEALEERLAPPLKKAGETAALDAFKAQFDGVNFSKGLEITFTQTGKKLITKIGGQPAGELSNPALSRALFDIYLGRDPASPDAKATFGSTLAATLKPEAKA